MVVTPVRTYRIDYFEQPSLEEVLVDCLPTLAENSVVAINAKIVSICEGSFDYDAGYAYALQPTNPDYVARRTQQFLAGHFEIKNVCVLVVTGKGTLLARSCKHVEAIKLALFAATAMQLSRLTPIAIISDFGTLFT